MSFCASSLFKVLVEGKLIADNLSYEEGFNMYWRYARDGHSVQLAPMSVNI